MVPTMAVAATPKPMELSAAPASTAGKKCPPNIRTGIANPPVLVSPISVAHGNAMLGVEGSKKGGANWMRDQWVANLKKKRMGAPGAPAGPEAPVMTAPLAPVPTVKAGVRAESSRSSSEKTTTSRSKRSTKSKTSGANATANVASVPVNTALAPSDKDSLSLMNPALFFNDLGCFELESPSFMRLTPRDSLGRDISLDANLLPSPAQASAALKADKKWMKPLMKKRSSCFAADLNSDPKRRTPRRSNNSAGTFDESDSAASSPHSYTSVGTPSNFHSADVSRMWGPEIDLSSGYVDTFLDLPTPKSAEMPSMTARTPSSSSTPQSYDDLEQPKLIRTTSIEQEGLSQFFEQTTLGEGELRQSSKTTKPQSCRVNTTAAAAHTVDEYFGKIAPSPAHCAFNNSRCLQPTPKGTLRLHQASSNYSFDQPQKSSGSNPHAAASSSSEFDTLVQDYEFTDFDQELDSFYLDTIESFGGDLDLISN